MPYTTRTLKGGKVQVSGPSGVHAKATSPARAKRQVRLLQAVDHGFTPTGKPARKRRTKTKRNPVTLQAAKRRG